MQNNHHLLNNMKKSLLIFIKTIKINLIKYYNIKRCMKKLRFNLINLNYNILAVMKK